MKYLLIFLITFTAHANYIKKSQVGSCDTIKLEVFMSKLKCGDDCIKIDKNYNCEYSEIEPAKDLKADVISCNDESDCSEKFISLECSNESFHRIKNIDLMEVYCTKHIPEHIKSDESKKADYDETNRVKEKDKKDKRGVIKSIRDKTDPFTDDDHKKLYRYILKNI